MKFTYVNNLQTAAPYDDISASVSSSYYDRYNDVIKQYLPTTGEGDSLATQLVTAITKLIYRWYNDGDVYDNQYGMEGWANDLSSYANWIYNHYSSSRPILEKISHTFNDDQYEHILRVLAYKFFVPDFLAEEATKPADGSIYDEDGPFAVVDDEEAYEDEAYEDEDIYSGVATPEVPDILRYARDNKCQRYIHSLIPEIDELLEDEGYVAEFEENDTTLFISIYPQGEEYCDGTYSFPKSALDCESWDTYTDASNIVEILMNRAHFEDLYGCITSASSLCASAEGSPAEKHTVSDNYKNILHKILSDKLQRRIYGKFMNVETQYAEAWLQGVLDSAELIGVEMAGIEDLWEMIQMDGIDSVIRSLKNC